MIKRKPDIVIGDRYLHRWYIIPRNRFFNIYLHKFIGSDDDRALHDHPWHSVSFLLRGYATEVSLKDGASSFKSVPRFIPIFRRAEFAHRIIVLAGPVWTVFITGPRIREWGFLCPSGWRHWTKFTDRQGNNIGPGCD